MEEPCSAQEFTYISTPWLVTGREWPRGNGQQQKIQRAKSWACQPVLIPTAHTNSHMEACQDVDEVNLPRSQSHLIALYKGMAAMAGI